MTDEQIILVVTLAQLFYSFIVPSHLEQKSSHVGDGNNKPANNQFPPDSVVKNNNDIK